MNDRYDYLVIGSGPAGHVSAIKAAQLGLSVAVVEKDGDMFGGVCLNEGCIPAKSLYHSAAVFDVARKNPEICGCEAKCDTADMSGFVEKSRGAARQLREGLSFLFKKNGIDLIRGRAQFIDAETVRISNGTETSDVKAGKFLIATGSVASVLTGIPFDGTNVITSSDGIRLSKVPGEMLIVGGGAIGTEFASFFNTVGAKVTVVELEETLLPLEDREVARCLKTVFKQRGITVLTGSRLKNIVIEDKTTRVTIEGKEDENTGSYGVVLVSVGRQPATSGIGLEVAGVKIDDKGFIPVNTEMRTSAENIYAAGDVLRSPMLAHVAYAEGEAAAEAAAGGAPEAIDYSAVPNAVYTGIQVASVGMTEEKAKAKNIDVAVGKQFFKSNGRAVVNAETEGFIKVIARRDTRRLLGAHIIGHEAAELIHEFVVAKKAGLTVDDIAKTIHAHPTFSETAVDACRSVFGNPIYG
jgi:dihydrolipoamide dehydrogenase